MKRLLIHLGPHKTGSTYIQRMMKVNAKCFPDTHRATPRSDPLLEVLHRTTLGLHKPEDAPEFLDLIGETSAELGKTFEANNTLISDEDFLGPLPTRVRINGLYPFLHSTLPVMLKGFKSANLDVRFFFYVREYDDWLRSLHSYKFREKERLFAPRKFKARNGLPDDWQETFARLEAAVGAENIIFDSYEKDRATGRFGTALFHEFGLDNETLDTFEWIEPVNVSRPETVDPAFW